MLRKGVPMGKKRREYSREFKLEAVKMVVEQGRTATEAAEGLGIDRSLLQRWKQEFVAVSTSTDRRLATGLTQRLAQSGMP